MNLGTKSKQIAIDREIKKKNVKKIITAQQTAVTNKKSFLQIPVGTTMRPIYEFVISV